MPLPRDPATLLVGCPALLPRGPLAGRDRRADGHQPVERLADAQRGAEAGHRRDPDQRPRRPGARARGGAADPVRPPRRPGGPRRPRRRACGSRTRSAPRPPGCSLENLKDSMTVALSWGHALQSMVYATTAEQEHHRLTLVQLVGGLSSIRNEISGQELVRELAVRLGAGYRFLHAPATLESSTSRDALLAESSIADALKAAGRADLAVVGIGTPSPRLLGGDPRLAQPAASRGAGVLGRRPGRRHRGPLLRRRRGQPIHGAVEDRILGVTLDDLVAIPHVDRRGPRPRQGPRRPRCPARAPHRLPGVRRSPRPPPAQRGAHRRPHPTTEVPDMPTPYFYPAGRRGRWAGSSSSS